MRFDINNTMTDQDSSSLSKSIYESLKRQILNLELLPGEKMSEAKVAKLIGCSRTPVRDAFYQLRVEGFLVSRPQIGTFVPPIDMRRVEEVRFIRESLEIATIKYGMRHNCFDGYIDRFQEIINAQERLYSEQRYDEFNELDIEFHGLFRKVTGKDSAKMYCGDDDINYARLRFMSVRYEQNWHIAIEHHQAILDAVKENDICKMEAAVTAHLHNLYKVLKTTDLNNPRILTNYDEVMQNIDEL